jgi:hypothetical protein
MFLFSLFSKVNSLASFYKLSYRNCRSLWLFMLISSSKCTSALRGLMCELKPIWNRDRERLEMRKRRYPSLALNWILDKTEISVFWYWTEYMPKYEDSRRLELKWINAKNFWLWHWTEYMPKTEISVFGTELNSWKKREISFEYMPKTEISHLLAPRVKLVHRFPFMSNSGQL